MKLLAIEMTHVTSLFQLTRPQGQLFLPMAIALLKDRYSFAGASNPLERKDSDKLEFSHGIFDGNGIEELSVYNDGVIVRSRSNSDVLDEFLTDLRSFVESELGLVVIQTHQINRLYESILIAEFSSNPLTLLEQYSNISRQVELKLQETSCLEVSYNPYGFKLSPDETKIAAMKPGPFTIERRAGIGLEMNQFFCVAPLRTNDHIEILEALDS